MPKTHPCYSAELRAEAIRLVRSSGKSKTAIARDLGISLEALRALVRQAELDASERHDGLTSEELAELRRLRREVKNLARRAGNPGKSRSLLRSGDQLAAVRKYEFIERLKAAFP